jgi:hypothetical protein
MNLLHGRTSRSRHVSQAINTLVVVSDPGVSVSLVMTTIAERQKDVQVGAV